MRDLAEVAAIVLSLATLLGTIELFLVTLGGVLPRRRHLPGPLGRTPRLAVVVPAHDEEDAIVRCVGSLLTSDPHVDVFVVADNCSDETAALAATGGARVLVRRDQERLGKGYALDFAFRELAGENFEAFVVVDADSVVDSNFIPACRRLFAAGADAVQVRYTVLNPDDSLRTRLMHVAFLAFNGLRPRGRDRFKLSAGIVGNGFGLTRETLEEVPYEAHSVVEDLEYHLDLVDSGRCVRFADETRVRAEMPAGGRGVRTQRVRWEGGRLRMAFERGPRLLRAVLSGRLRLLEPLLELLLMPLAYHALLLVAALALLDPSHPWRWVPIVGLGVLAAHVLASLVIGKARLIDYAVLLAAPFYVLWKLLVAPSILAASRRRAAWVRTQRNKRSSRRA